MGITGTNGKSTVTTLVGLMLQRAKKKVLVAGNIGNALTEEPRLLKGQDWIVAELSSFQLEDIETFRPRVATILNVTQDHLDRYATIEEYAEAKARVFLNSAKGGHAGPELRRSRGEGHGEADHCHGRSLFAAAAVQPRRLRSRRLS